MDKEEIISASAPAAIGPYSQAVRAGVFIFTSGQIPVEPSTGAVVDKGIGEQTRRVLENLRAVLEAAGSSLAGVVKTTVFLKDISAFAEMNKVYEGFFSPPYPARSTVAVKDLPKGVDIEIDAVAVKDAAARQG
jgi:2-iminobutanoate/2-iminopropanoate deaminase